MKIYILTCLVIFLIACSNPESSQLVSDRIKIVSPQNGIWVAEEIPIEVELSDGETAKMIELWVNGRAHRPVDYSRPYSFNWSTINYPDSSTHELFVRVYYSDNRRIDSEKVNLHVDNSS